ncbi:GtrA family protein [Vibrio sp. RC27]
MKNTYFKYCLIGALNTLIHMLCFFMLFKYVGFNLVVSNVCSFAISVSISYILNSIYTFSSTIRASLFLIYFLFMLVLYTVTSYICELLSGHYLSIFSILIFNSFIGFSLTRWLVGFEKRKLHFN